MAHFAQLDENNIVVNVIKINDNDIIDENGNESEELGIQICQSHFPNTRWVQTSFNNNMRGQYAGKGLYYNEEHDVFTIPSPHPSWIFNANEMVWESPIPCPTDTLDEGQIYQWNELEQKWFVDNIPNPYFTPDGQPLYDQEIFDNIWTGLEWVLIPIEQPEPVGIAST